MLRTGIPSIHKYRVVFLLILAFVSLSTLVHAQEKIELSVRPENPLVTVQAGTKMPVKIDVIVVGAENIDTAQIDLFILETPSDPTGQQFQGQVTVEGGRSASRSMTIRGGIGTEAFAVEVSAQPYAQAGTYYGRILVSTPFGIRHLILTVNVRVEVHVFAAMLLGVLTSFFWSRLVGWLRGTGSSTRITARNIMPLAATLIVALVITVLLWPSFFETYTDIGKNPWIDYPVAFSFGFFWQEVLEKLRDTVRTKRVSQKTSTQSV